MSRRIVIIGFMGCGKTATAKALAHQLDCQMLDLDSFITAREGRSPAEIINQDGESFFREIETLALRDVLQDPNVKVLALGGGAWTIPENRTLVALYDCVSVWLDVPFEVCWERIATGNVVRPLAPEREMAKARYESRLADYASAEQRITIAHDDSAQAVASRILSRIAI